MALAACIPTGMLGVWPTVITIQFVNEGVSQVRSHCKVRKRHSLVHPKDPLAHPWSYSLSVLYNMLSPVEFCFSFVGVGNVQLSS